MAGELKEKCAVTGVYTFDGGPEASTLAYKSLSALQHRGTEATGMASSMPSGEIESHFGPGMVVNVYDDKEAAERLQPGNPVIGHNRYSTSGSKTKHPQPVVDAELGIAIAHNGNLPDTTSLEYFLGSRGLMHRQVNDSEMMALAISENARGKDLPSAIEESYPMFTGAFSCVGMQDDMMVAFRDPFGIRPLALGKIANGGYTVASETCAIDSIGASYERDIRPGELLIIRDEEIESRQLTDGEEKLDIFEMVYFARHDSTLYGQRVNEVRRHFGQQLAIEHGNPTGKDSALVVPVPDTSIPEAEGYADALGLQHRQAIIKDRYSGRSFMQTTDKARHDLLRRKHSLISEAVAGRDVILIDDSIVRLNTMPRLVEAARAAGAATVSVLIGSPPVRFPDFYGIDTPSQDKLAAANFTVEQIKEKIDCDYLGYLSLSRLVEATGQPASKFNLSCFTGEYSIDIGKRAKEIHTPVSMEYAE